MYTYNYLSGARTPRPSNTPEHVFSNTAFSNTPNTNGFCDTVESNTPERRLRTQTELEHTRTLKHFEHNLFCDTVEPNTRTRVLEHCVLEHSVFSNTVFSNTRTLSNTCSRPTYIYIYIYTYTVYMFSPPIYFWLFHPC